jgi:hypothetical protein
MSTQYPNPFATSQQPINSQSTRIAPSNGSRLPPSLPLHPFSHRQSQPIDLDSLEVVDLTNTPATSRPPRRPLESPSSSDRPAKRNKGKDTEVYISLEDDEPPRKSPSKSPSKSVKRHKSPTQTGALSSAKCVICLDLPTDLAATPCGICF